MTPDGCRGSFHVLGSAAAWDTGSGSGNKKEPEKSDPTPLSYHTLSFKSTGKWLPEGKICALHKNRCVLLGNIPS